MWQTKVLLVDHPKLTLRQTYTLVKVIIVLFGQVILPIVFTWMLQ